MRSISPFYSSISPFLAQTIRMNACPCLTNGAQQDEKVTIELVLTSHGFARVRFAFGRPLKLLVEE